MVVSTLLHNAVYSNFLIQEKQNGNVVSTSHWIRPVIRGFRTLHGIRKPRYGKAQKRHIIPCYTILYFIEESDPWIKIKSSKIFKKVILLLVMIYCPF